MEVFSEMRRYKISLFLPKNFYQVFDLIYSFKNNWSGPRPSGF